MRIIDETRAPRPAPQLQPQAGTGPALPPGAPRPPWRAELRPYGGHSGTVPNYRLTKIFGTGTVGELVVPGSEEEQWWAYCSWLEREVARLQVAGETAVLLASGPPAEAPKPTAGVPSSPIEPIANNVLGRDILVEPRDGSANAGGAPAAPGAATPGAPNDVMAAPELQAQAEDKRARAMRELLADPGASNGVLAERADCSDEFVRRLRHQLQSEGRLQPVSVVVKRDGATYPIANAPEKQGDGEAVVPANGVTG